MREDLIYWRYQVEERLSDCWFLSRKILSIFSGWGELHHARCHKVSFPGPVPRPATTRPGLHLRLTNSEMFTLQITVSKKQTNYFLSASRDWWEDTEPSSSLYISSTNISLDWSTSHRQEYHNRHQTRRNYTSYIRVNISKKINALTIKFLCF